MYFISYRNICILVSDTLSLKFSMCYISEVYLALPKLHVGLKIYIFVWYTCTRVIMYIHDYIPMNQLLAPHFERCIFNYIWWSENNFMLTEWNQHFVTESQKKKVLLNALALMHLESYVCKVVLYRLSIFFFLSPGTSSLLSVLYLTAKLIFGQDMFIQVANLGLFAYR